jgi:L-amino acid N-acyltransferase YncA
MDSGIPTARELAGYSLSAQHPLTRSWVADPVRLDLLIEGHELDILLASDLEVAAARATRFAPRHPPEALLNRWIRVTEDLHAMMSMRYEGLDPSKPFVDATPLSRPLRADDLSPLARAAERAYGQLHPGYLRLWSAEPPGRFTESRSDRRFLAAPIQSLRAGSGGHVPDELAISPAETLRDYDRARRAYEAVDTEHPEHRAQACLQDYEDLEQSLRDRTLFDVTVDGAWAGYVAATTNEDTLGMPAYVVQEVVLTPEFRGRGYGAYLSVLLAGALPDPTRILVGIIHADNRGARQSAERAGRIDVGGWIQVRLPTA